MPAPTGSRASVIAAFTPSALRNVLSYAGLGVIDDSIACQVVLTPLGQHRLSIINTTLETGLAGDDRAFANGVPQLVALTKTGTDYRCRAAPTEIIASTNVTADPPALGLRARAARSSRSWCRSRRRRSSCCCARTRPRPVSPDADTQAYCNSVAYPQYHCVHVAFVSDHGLVGHWIGSAIEFMSRHGVK